jgi:chromosome segregation ATPase
MDIALLEKIEKKIENLISKYKSLENKYREVSKKNEELNNKYKDLFLHNENSEKQVKEFELEFQKYKGQASDLTERLAQKEKRLESYIKQATEIDSRVDLLLSAIDEVLAEKYLHEKN